MLISGHFFRAGAGADWHAALHPGLARKVDTYAARLNILLFHRNFAHVQEALGTTPAVAAGISNHVWTLDDLAALRQG